MKVLDLTSMTNLAVILCAALEQLDAAAVSLPLAPLAVESIDALVSRVDHDAVAVKVAVFELTDVG